MNRFFCKQLDEIVILEGENHTHIAYSLRLRVGEEIVLFCGDGYDYQYKITEIKKSETRLQFLSKQENTAETSINIHAYISLIKQDKMSLVFQKLTELGVKEFFPSLTKYSQGGKKDFNKDRFERICIEACKQCGRSVLPQVNETISFPQIKEKLNGYDIVIFAYEKATYSLKDYLEELIKTKSFTKENLKIALLIGAEGGFSTSEVDELKEKGYQPISLGKRILRAETAAIATTSCLIYQLEN